MVTMYEIINEYNLSAMFIEEQEKQRFFSVIL